MKQYTSRFFKSIAAAYLVFPIIYIVMAATSFDISLSGCMRILLSPLYYIVTLCALIAGFGLWEVRRWSWYIYVLAQIFICYENAIFVSDYAESHHKIFVFIISILLQLLLSFRVAKEIRVPYFFPKIRWWENNPRYKMSIPVQVIRGSGEKLAGEILDISSAGCFIKFRADVPADEKVKVELEIFGHPLSLPGTIVWCAQSTVTHPRGIGVMFSFLTKEQRRIFRTVTSRLRKIAAHYRRSRYLMSSEDFIKRLDEIELASLERSKSSSNRPASHGTL